MIKRKKKTTEDIVTQLAQEYLQGYVTTMAENISRLQMQVTKLESTGIDQAINRINARHDELANDLQRMIDELKPEESVRYQIEELQTRLEHLEAQQGY
jgi:archaellum component FlaC